MSSVSADPARLVRYRQVSGDLDEEVRAAAQALQAAADIATIDTATTGDARGLVEVAAARDLAEAMVALWRAEVRTTRWVGAVGAALTRADAGALDSTVAAAVADASSAPDAASFAGRLRRLQSLHVGPEVVAALVAVVPAAWLAWAARSQPDLVGPVDGMPVAVRYDANHVLLHRMLVGETDPDRRSVLHSLAAGDASTGTARQFLLIDPSGDGRVIEVFGDLTSAEAVGVIVPGADSDLATYERRLARQARGLQQRADATSAGSTAVVAWLGTDTPDGLSRNPAAILEMATASLAHGGGRRLHRTVDGLGLRAEQRVVLVGHSYGSTTVGAALLDGVRADDVIVAGSPGVLVDHAHDFGRPRTRFYALEAPGDLVTRTQRFGADPARPGSGFVRLETGGHGHSAYLVDASTSQANVVAVLTGDDETLVRRTDSPAEMGEASLDRALDRLEIAARRYRRWAETRSHPAVAAIGPGMEELGHVVATEGRTRAHDAGELIDDLTGLVRAIG